MRHQAQGGRTLLYFFWISRSTTATPARRLAWTAVGSWGANLIACCTEEVTSVEMETAFRLDCSLTARLNSDGHEIWTLTAGAGGGGGVELTALVNRLAFDFKIASFGWKVLWKGPLRVVVLDGLISMSSNSVWKACPLAGDWLRRRGGGEGDADLLKGVLAKEGECQSCVTEVKWDADHQTHWRARSF